VAWVAVSVVARELARLLASARAGAEPELVTWWPLGALCGPQGLRGTRRQLAVLATPLLVNVAIALAAAAGLLALGVPGGSLTAHVVDPTTGAAIVATSTATLVLWWGYYINVAFVALNLLPMPPLDCGRLLESLATQGGRRGPRRKAVVVGLTVGAALLVIGMTLEQPRLLGIACVGLLVGMLELRRIEALAEPVPAADPPRDGLHLEGSVDEIDPPIVELPSEPEPTEEHELDAVLEKISRSGMGSLDEQERRVLDLATRRRRDGM
jgi:Zn-dependent protease